MSGHFSSAFRLWYLEDDDNDAMLLQRAVTHARRTCHLTRFSDAPHAMATLEKITRPDRQSPHFIITDLKMPGLSGIEFVQWLRASRFPSLPVMIFTASALPGDIVRAYEAGANAFATKPVDFTDLKRVIENLFNFWLDVCLLHEQNPLLGHAPELAQPGWH